MCDERDATVYYSVSVPESASKMVTGNTVTGMSAQVMYAKTCLM